MANYLYVALLALCPLATIPLEYAYGFKVWRSPKRLLLSLLPGFVVFLSWDILAVDRGLWWFNPDYVVGWNIGSMPLEEILFFLIVPTAGISGYEAVRASLKKMQHA